MTARQVRVPGSLDLELAWEAVSGVLAPTPAVLTQESWDHGVLVRLADPSNAAQGRRQFETVLREMVRTQGVPIKTEPIVELVPVRTLYAGNVRRPLLLVVGAAIVLLLTACAGIANVFLARAASRSRLRSILRAVIRRSHRRSSGTPPPVLSKQDRAHAGSRSTRREPGARLTGNSGPTFGSAVMLLSAWCRHRRRCR